MSPGFELEIDLSDEEINRLEREVVKGVATLRNEDGDGNRSHTQKDLSVLCGALSQNLFVELATTPPDVNLAEATGYLITLSLEGYRLLRSKGKTGDRLGGTAKVTLKNEHYHRLHDRWCNCQGNG